MIAKLLTLLSAAKGATVAAVVVLGAATATVGVTSPEVRDTVEQVVAAVTGQTVETKETKANETDADERCGGGQPAVVAQRNAADKLLRDSFQTHQKALEDLRGKGTDNKVAGPIIKKADDDLKDVRTKALNAVAANTQGREGQNKDTTAAGTPKPSKSPKPSCAPAAAAAAPAETKLVAANQAIVDNAIKAMDAIVTAAQTAVAALPSPDHGKPADAGSNGNKPADAGNGNKPADAGSNTAKPATVPGGKPSESPRR